ncbi:MAG TPA: PDR/VanB family oxidoreductase [Ramlibacter sp.]|nr:PDR/VanB family oxidoreductase [Ramlibacter sp.]
MMAAATLAVVVQAAALVAQDVRQLELVRADGALLPAFTPGAHIDLHLGPGLVRQYSLCGPASDRSRYLVAVKLETPSRGGSRAAHQGLAVGSGVVISAPRNHFPVRLDARHSVLVAGGIGITPLLSMAHALAEERRSFELLYFCRSPAHAAFRESLQDGPLAGRCRFFFGLARDAARVALGEALALHAPGHHLYLCGPQPFMDTVRAVAHDTWPAESVHLEYFAAPATDGGAEAPFRVRLARSEQEIVVAAGQSLADALRAAGAAVETSCEQGVCGTCLTRVLDGEPDHRDCFLTGAEKARGDHMALCVSRSRSPLLVLDL